MSDALPILMPTWWSYAKECGFEVAKLEAISEQLQEFYLKVAEENSKQIIEATIARVNSELQWAKSRLVEATANAQVGSAVPSNIVDMVKESQARQFKWTVAFDKCLAAVTDYEVQGRMDETVWGAFNNAIETVGKATAGIGFLVLVCLVAYLFLKG